MTRPPRPFAIFAASWLCFAAAATAPLQTPGGTQALAGEAFLRRFAASAVERTRHAVRYDPAYVRIPYPNGDVPESTEVCTDEVIRAFRGVSVDLQKEVHEDMVAHPDAYPRKWGAARSDTNIDHRRVPNLMVFFSRRGESLPVTGSAEDYRPGELVAWNLGGGLTHIGIVVETKSPETGRHLVVHNIGAGPKMEDVLFAWKIIGHYRYPAGPARGRSGRHSLRSATRARSS